MSHSEIISECVRLYNKAGEVRNAIDLTTVSLIEKYNLDWRKLSRLISPFEGSSLLRKYLIMSAIQEAIQRKRVLEAQEAANKQKKLEAAEARRQSNINARNMFVETLGVIPGCNVEFYDDPPSFTLWKGRNLIASGQFTHVEEKDYDRDMHTRVPTGRYKPRVNLLVGSKDAGSTVTTFANALVEYLGL